MQNILNKLKKHWAATGIIAFVFSLMGLQSYISVVPLKEWALAVIFLMLSWFMLVALGKLSATLVSEHDDDDFL